MFGFVANWFDPRGWGHHHPGYWDHWHHFHQGW